MPQNAICRLDLHCNLTLDLGRLEPNVRYPSRDSGDNSALLEDFIHAKTNEQEKVGDRPKKEKPQLIRRYVTQRIVHWMPLNNFSENRSTQIKTSPQIEE